jgi:hypothetical protein
LVDERTDEPQKLDVFKPVHTTDQELANFEIRYAAAGGRAGFVPDEDALPLVSLTCLPGVTRGGWWWT